MRNSLIIIISFIFIVDLASCTKYEDGPILTFRSKKTRIVNTWKYESIIYVEQNSVVTENLPTIEFTCSKDGLYSDNEDSVGTWKFSGEVDLIISKSKNSTTTETKWEIIKLAKKQLWLRINKVEHHFIPR
ncbi:MAG: hypothetical protein COS14_01270 [Bacteroidetes bacterium CG02_land_8_20_14_3_00_31_25]|nr:hypothetical protein [Bacteroidota bacterium]PIV62994.1 MAG: hypothetical protein COS14_01270 [Bacteroidetes bacterium CG02_land_8_20_14_3_00_31_25]PIX36606.1 MAG: hypothetical protein COZ59_00155 [Bacteroidetes bacterium CG_4_8_14_3_um_filter_31_14]PIY04952.1 MAG: hypothetical protein COZ21_05175 [Bacteroidetes bacterium CG_4_10_14_3_um_filter_31_20]